MDPAIPKEIHQTCEKEAIIDKTDCVEVEKEEEKEEETKESEVINEEVRRNSLIKVAQMKILLKNAGALTKKTKEKVPKQTAWDRFSRTSSKVTISWK